VPAVGARLNCVEVAEDFAMRRPPVHDHEATLTLRVEVADASTRIFRLSETFAFDAFRLRLTILTTETNEAAAPLTAA
jgi:hypothetical protein